MTTTELRNLYAYHRWANQRMLLTCARLTPDEAEQRIESSFPSVLATLVHMLSADWIWLQRWNGKSPSGWLEAEKLTSIGAVLKRWESFEAEQQAFVESRCDADLAAAISYRSLKGDSHTNVLADIMVHVVNHASYHRGQVTTMLRQLGQTPLPTDYILFLREPRPTT